MSESPTKIFFEKIQLSPDEVAKLLKVTKDAVYKWMRGDREIDYAKMKILEQYAATKKKPSSSPINRKSAGEINLKAFRKGMRIAQNEIAAVLGTSQSWVSQVENGLTYLTLEQENKILNKWPEAKLYRQLVFEGHFSKDDYEFWKKRVEDLEARIKDKEEIINLLKQNNTLLKERAEFPEENDHDNHKAG